MSRTFDFAVGAELDELGGVRSFVRRAGESLGASETVIGDLCLVVDEAVTNVILHGYAGHPGEIRLQLSGEGRDLVVRIVDDAPAFDAGAVEPPHLDQDLAERKFGVMGVYLIRRMTDEARFTPRPGGGYRGCGGLQVQFPHVAVLDRVVGAALLPVEHPAAPDAGEFQAVCDVPVHPVGD